MSIVATNAGAQSLITPAGRWIAVAGWIGTGGLALAGAGPVIVAIAAGLAAAAAAGCTRPRRAVAATDELLRQLARARRRDERAHVAVVKASRAAEAARMASTVRITDTVLSVSRPSGTELWCILDGPAVDRAAFERRLSDQDAAASFGWARFPDDGTSVETLVERARARGGHDAAPQAVPALEHAQRSPSCAA